MLTVIADHFLQNGFFNDFRLNRFSCLLSSCPVASISFAFWNAFSADSVSLLKYPSSRPGTYPKLLAFLVHAFTWTSFELYESVFQFELASHGSNLVVSLLQLAIPFYESNSIWS